MLHHDLLRPAAQKSETGEAGDLSLKMLYLLAAGLSLWMVYGFMRGDVVIILANNVSLALLGGA